MVKGVHVYHLHQGLSRLLGEPANLRPVLLLTKVHNKYLPLLKMICLEAITWLRQTVSEHGGMLRLRRERCRPQVYGMNLYPYL